MDKVQIQNESASKGKVKTNEQVKSEKVRKIHVKEEQEPGKRFSIKVGDQNKAKLQNSVKILSISEKNSKIIQNIQNVQKSKMKTTSAKSFTKTSAGTLNLIIRSFDFICLNILSAYSLNNI